MQTVIETEAFLRSAKDAKMPDETRTRIVSVVAETPQIGDRLRGTGGCRKFRFAGTGRGKSGRFRVVYFYSGPDIPVFLLTVFGKNEKSNITAAEAKQLAQLTKILAESYENKIVDMRKVRR